MLHRWLKEHARTGCRQPQRAEPTNVGARIHRVAPAQRQPAAVATELRIELRKGALWMTVSWPIHAAAAHCALCAMGGGGAQVIRINAVWLAITPMDRRAGTETVVARVAAVFGTAHPYTAYIFANKRGNRLKVLVHDWFGIWLAARRLHQGRFH